MLKQDANWRTTFAYMFFYGVPFSIAYLCSKSHEQLIDTLAWIVDIFMGDFRFGMALLFLGSIISVPLNIPYAINEVFMSYCFIRRWGMFVGVSVFLLVDPIIFAISSLLPFFLTRMLCSKLVSRLLIDTMRVLRACEAVFETHSL